MKSKILLLCLWLMGQFVSAQQNNDCFLLLASSETVFTTQIATVDITVRDFENIASMQFSMEWNPSIFAFHHISIPANNPLGLEVGQNFGVSAVAAGKLRFAWNDPFVSGKTLPDDAVIFELHLGAVGTFGQSTGVRFSGSPLPFETATITGDMKPFNQKVGQLTIGTPPSSGLEMTFESACTAPSGCSAAAGAVSVEIENGTPPYSYSWSGNFGFTSTLPHIFNLAPGVYFLTVTDADGKVLKGQFVVESENSPVNIFDADIEPATCPDENGAINLSVSSQSMPLNYIWSNGAATQDLTSLSPGNYSVTVVDGLGCVAWKSFTVPEISGIEVEHDITSPDCQTSSGAIQTTVSGGEPPYSYIWSTGAQTGDVQGLTPGIYSIQVTDNLGCVESKSITVADFTANAWEVATLPQCHPNDSTGQIVVVIYDAPGIQPPVTYAWSNGQTHVKDMVQGVDPYRDTLPNLLSGAFSVTISDNNGCQKVLNEVLDCTSPSNGPSDCLGFELGDSMGEKGEITCLPLRTKGFENIISYQFSLAWDPAALQFVEVKNFALNTISPSSFNIPDVYGDRLSHLWYDPTIASLTLPDETALFEVCFYLKPDAPGTSTDIYFANSPTPSEIVQNNEVNPNFVGFAGTISWSSNLPPLKIGACTVKPDCANDGKGTVKLFVDGSVFPYTIAWENNGQTFTGTASDLISLDPGGYQITVTDLAGFSAAATLNFPQLVDAECVWPGDLDNNNAVNHFDLLYLGLGMGKNGPSRQNLIGTDWVGQEAQNWQLQTPNRNINFKNLDADGDGAITEKDALAIDKNWGSVIRPFYDNPDNAPFSGAVGNGPSFFVVPDTLEESQSAKLSVWLGTNAQPLTDIYGIAFSLAFDPAVVKPNQSKFEINNSWLGLEDDLLIVQKEFHGQGRLDIAIARNDGQAIPIGAGQLGELFIVIEDDIFQNRPADANPTELTSTDSLTSTFVQVQRVRAINAEEIERPITPKETTLQIKQKVVGTAHPNDVSNRIAISPNPVDNTLKINALDSKIETLEVLTVAGFSLRKVSGNGLPSGEFSVRDLPNGTYFLKIWTDGGFGVRKFLVQH